MSLDYERAAVLGLLAFAASMSVLATVGVILALVRLAADTAAALVAAAPAGIGISLALRKGK